MQARDERAVCGVERESSRGGRGDGQPVKRSKPRVGHGGVDTTYRMRSWLESVLRIQRILELRPLVALL